MFDAQILEQMGVPVWVRRTQLMSVSATQQVADDTSIQQGADVNTAPVVIDVEYLYRGPDAQWLFIEDRYCAHSIMTGDCKMLFKQILNALQIDVKAMAIGRADLQQHAVVQLAEPPAKIPHVVYLSQYIRENALPHPEDLLQHPVLKKQLWMRWQNLYTNTSLNT